MPSTRVLIIVLIIFNLISIGFAEVQRRALVDKTIEYQRVIEAELNKRTGTALNQMTASVKESTRLLTTRMDALLQLYGIKLDAPQRKPIENDAVLAYNITLLKSALNSYRQDNKSFPLLGTVYASALAPALVDGGYLREIPSEYLGRPIYYTTDGAANGQHYGLKVPRASGGDCLTGQNEKNRGWFGQLPACEF